MNRRSVVYGSESPINIGAINGREDQLVYKEEDVGNIPKELECRRRFDRAERPRRTMPSYSDRSGSLSER